MLSLIRRTRAAHYRRGLQRHRRRLQSSTEDAEFQHDLLVHGNILASEEAFAASRAFLATRFYHRRLGAIGGQKTEEATTLDTCTLQEVPRPCHEDPTSAYDESVIRKASQPTLQGARGKTGDVEGWGASRWQ